MCHRTHVAVRTLTLAAKQWQKFLAGQYPTEEFRDQDEREADAFITENILRVYQWEVDEALHALEDLKYEGMQGNRDVLVKRWKQIRHMVRQAMKASVGQ